MSTTTGLNGKHRSGTDVTLLRLDQLYRDPRCQARCAFSKTHADELADLRRRGIEYSDPVVVFYDSERYILAAGWHRCAGEEDANGPRAWIKADVRKGTLRDAQLFAAGDNKEAKLGRSIEDKRRAVLTLLVDEEWGAWPATRIADHCGVSEGFVRQLRGEMAEEEAREAEEAKREEARRRENSSRAEAKGKEPSGDAEKSYNTKPPPKPKRTDAETVDWFSKKRKKRADFKDRPQALAEIRRCLERGLKLARSLGEKKTARQIHTALVGLAAS